MIRTVQDLRQASYADAETGCWLWRGATSQSGHPSFWIPAIGKVGSLGTFLNLVLHGRRPNKGECWVAECKNKLCVRPAIGHRILAGHKEAMLLSRPTLPLLHKAKIAEARRAGSRINTDIASEVRASQESGKVLAERFGVSTSLISCIRKDKVWRAGTAGSVFSWRP